MKTKSKPKTETFEVKSGELLFGDPCYGVNESCVAQNGPWTAHVVLSDEGGWGQRVKRVVVHHKDFNPADRRILVETTNFGVDSGQAGVFDRGSYGGEGFYDLCCKETLSDRQYGYLDCGFVTSSGYGDGYYEAEIHKINGVAVCVELTFIADEQ